MSINTRKALEHLPSHIRRHVENLKTEYNRETDFINHKKSVRYGAMEYLTALCHVDAIKEIEMRLLFSYITL